MPELTWTTALAWFGVLASAASVAGLVFGLVGAWQTTRLQADIHAATQLTLTDLRKGFSESQERLGETTKAVGQGVQQLGQILDGMDRRWQQAFERMDQRADERHREMVEAIQALRR